MQTIHQQKVFLFYQTVLVSGSMHLFGFSPAIRNLAAVNRIFQNHADQTSIKKRIFPVLALDFADPMIFKIFGEDVYKRQFRYHADDDIIDANAFS